MWIYIQLHNISCALSTSQGMWEYGEAIVAFDDYKGTSTRTLHTRDEQVKGLHQPWLLKRTCLLQWKKTMQYGNICMEHQGSPTAARSKCVHSHPLYTWDPWSWNKSHLYGIDKGAYLIKYKAVCDVSEQVSVFATMSVSTVDVVAAGNNYLVCLYNGKPGTGLNSLWYNRFWKKGSH